MAAVQSPNLGIYNGWSLGESGWNVQMDSNLKALDAVAGFGVKSATTTTTPATANPGDRYIVPASGVSGDWVGQEGKFVIYDANDVAWLSFTPKEGWTAIAVDTGQTYVHNGTAWVLKGSLLSSYANDGAAATGGVPVGGEYINSSTGALTIRQT